MVEERIADVLWAHGELSLAASLLVNLANEQGGLDNVTRVLAR